MIPNDEHVDESLRLALLGAGKLLFFLQQLENMVRLCCAFLQINGIHITVDDVFSEEPKKRFHTLGRMLSTIQEPMGFKPSFRRRLDDFIKARNTFIHDYWVKNELYSIDEPIDQATSKKITAFEESLYRETIYMTQVFIGLHYSIGALLASRQGLTNEFETDPEYEKMRECAPAFLSALENAQG
jgi:hypothetical protein